MIILLEHFLVYILEIRSPAMIKNYFKVAVRNLLRKKGFSLINILGLSIGIACCLLILLHVQDELSYDKHHEKSDRIHRMALERIYPDHTSYYAVIPAGFSAVVPEDIPEVKSATRLFRPFQDIVVTIDEDVYKEERADVMFADSNVFEVFTIEMLEGDPATALTKPNSVLITEKVAQKYFGTTEAIGKQFTTNQGEVIVTGILAEQSDNSHLSFELLFSPQLLPFLQQPNYVSFSAYTYLLLEPGTDPKVVESKLPKVVETYASGQIQQRMSISYEEYIQAGNGYEYFLQPLKDIHLHSQLEGEARPNGNITYIYLFVAIAIFILLLACINFMNLSTARSAERAREVGVRKVMGSVRQQLIGQFLMESVLVSLLSLFVAVALVRLGLPFFNQWADKTLVLDFGQMAWLIPALLLFAAVVGLLAGSYPAFVLSSFSPVTVLKGNFKTSQKGTLLRNGLVVFQFAISIFLIAGTLVVYRQLAYMQEKNQGYTEDPVMVLDRFNSLGEKAESFKQELLENPDILFTGSASAMPGGFYFGFTLQERPSSEVLTTKAMAMDDDFAETMDFEMVAGRAFSRNFDDTLSLILNESAVKNLGLKDPVGKKMYNSANDGTLTEFTVVGVMKDFHFESLHLDIGNLAIQSNEFFNGPGGQLAIRTKGSNLSEAIAHVESKWREFNPTQPFTYSFLDEDLAEMYLNEQRVSKLSTVFTGLAILIACIGLFGLSAFMAQQRTKEIGIRKVMGASVPQLVMMLSKHFTYLVLGAFALASLVLWFAAGEWLTDFAYRISLLQNWDIFVIAGGLALIVAWLTISFQSIKAAIANPIKSLRHE